MVRTTATLLAGLFAWSCGSEAPPTTSPTEAPIAAEVEVEPSQSALPNIVLVTLDTTRADALGAYGQSRPTSPNFDRLAQSGVVFEQASSSNPETLPSHATLFTSKWPFSHGIRGNAGHRLAEQHTTLAEVLKASGYRTGAEIAAQVLRSDTGVTQGFDHVRDAESPGVKLKSIQLGGGSQTVPMRTGPDITKRGIEFIRNRSKAPFFLWLHYFDAHDPYEPPAAVRTSFPDSAYHAEVAVADAALGRFIDTLDEEGLTDNTVFVVTSDHGEGLGDHNEPTHSYFVYEATMRVPLILAGPGIPSGVRIEAPVRTLDVMPTVLELIGLPAPDEVEGISLAAHIRGAGAAPTLPGYGEASRFSATLELPMLRFYREGQWKYIHKVNPELYDLGSDPEETTNVFADQPEVAARLESQLSKLLASAAPTSEARVEIEADTAQQLAALGYATRAVTPSNQDPMALFGEDPATKIDDARLLSEAQGLLDRKKWDEAWKRVEPARDQNPDSSYVLELAARNLVGLERESEAIDAFQQILRKSPCDRKSLELLPRLLRANTRYEDLVSVHASAHDRCPDLFENLNNYAWVLATLPVAELRDGAKAVALLKPAIDAKPGVDPTVLDTLAAAYAENGDFATAVATQRKALSQLRAAKAPPALIQLLEQHLVEFEADRPIREP